MIERKMVNLFAVRQLMAAAGVGVVMAGTIGAVPTAGTHRVADLTAMLQLAATEAAGVLDLGSSAAEVAQDAQVGDTAGSFDGADFAGIDAFDGVGIADPADFEDVLTWPVRFVEGIFDFAWGIITWPLELVGEVISEFFHILGLPFKFVGHGLDHITGIAEALANPDSLLDLPGVFDVPDITAGLGDVASLIDG